MALVERRACYQAAADARVVLAFIVRRTSVAIGAWGRVDLAIARAGRCGARARHALIDKICNVLRHLSHLWPNHVYATYLVLSSTSRGPTVVVLVAIEERLAVLAIGLGLTLAIGATRSIESPIQ